MLGTHRYRPDASEVYHAEEPGTGAELDESNVGDQEDIEEPEIEWDAETGIYCYFGRQEQPMRGIHQ